MKKIVLKIDGMKCGMCESHINDVVRQIDGVVKVKSSHSKNNTIIIAKDDVVISEIKYKIEKQGYYVLSEDISDYKEKKLFSSFRK